MKTAVVLALAWLVASAGAPPQARTIPAGARFDVLLKTPLTSATAKADQRFEAVSFQDYEMQGQVVMASGAIVRGFVSSVKPSSSIDRQGQLTLSFDELRIGDQALPLRASVEAVLDPKPAGDRTRMRAPPAVGGSADRGATPLMTVLVRAGGSIVSTGSADVGLPIGVILRIRLDRPLEVPR